MEPPDPTPVAPAQDAAMAATTELVGRANHAFGQVLERTTPWLIEFGSWIFGGFIALTILLIPSLITVGPVDTPILVATITLALALPLDVAGLMLLRLVRDMDRIGLAREWTQALQDAGLPVDASIPAPAAPVAGSARSSQFALLFASNVLTLSALLIVAGLVAALWHMAWWIAVAFLAMLAVSLAVVIVALTLARPPESPEVKERQRRYWDDLVKRVRAEAQAQAQAQRTER